MHKIIYLLKIKGVAKIPDYVQLRDEKMTLLAYFRADRPDKALTKAGFDKDLSYLLTIIEDIPFGVIKKIELPGL